MPVNKEKCTKNKVTLRKDCLTTTELAKLCGVSRFTIINWVNRGKIRTNKTVGGHSRIPVSEAISFYETLLKGNMGVTFESLCPCWEYPQKTNCDKECKSCLIYGSRTLYCFLVVSKLGKEVIHCEGDCSSCDYFEEFFSSCLKSEQLNETRETKGLTAAKDKKTFLYNAAYGLGRGIHEVKGKVTVIRDAWSKKLSESTTSTKGGGLRTGL